MPLTLQQRKDALAAISAAGPRGITNAEVATMIDADATEVRPILMANPNVRHVDSRWYLVNYQPEPPADATFVVLPAPLPTFPEIDAPERLTAAGIPVEAADDRAAALAGAASAWETHELQRTFAGTDQALREVIDRAASLLFALHAGSELDPGTAASLAHRQAAAVAAFARVTALRDAVRHRGALARPS